MDFESRLRAVEQKLGEVEENSKRWFQLAPIIAVAVSAVAVIVVVYLPLFF